MYSYYPDVNEFAMWLEENLPRRFLVLVLGSGGRFPSDEFDRKLRQMMTLGKGHWLNIDQISAGLPSMN